MNAYRVLVGLVVAPELGHELGGQARGRRGGGALGHAVVGALVERKVPRELDEVGPLLGAPAGLLRILWLLQIDPTWS